MKLKAGDKFIIIDKYHSGFGETGTIECVIDGIAYSDYARKIGYHLNGVGRLGMENGIPMIRKLTKLEKVLK